jgi:hypothetical protein
MPQLTEGADPDELERLAKLIYDGATQIDGVYAAVRSQFQSSSWQGPDADQFGVEWDGPSKARLSQATEALRQAGWSLNVNAYQQRSASGSDGGLGGGFGGLLHPGGFTYDPRMPSRIPGLGWRISPFFPFPPGSFGPILDLPGLGDLRGWRGLLGPGGSLNLGDPGMTPLLPLRIGSGAAPSVWNAIFGGFGGRFGGNASLVAGSSGLAAAASGLAFAGFSRSVSNSADLGPLHVQGAADGMIGASADGHLSATLGDGRLDASAGGALFAGTKGNVSGSANVGPIEAQAQGSAMVGVEASATASLHAGSDGIAAGASGGAFAGAAAQGSISGGIAGGTVSATGGVEAGVGLEGEARASVGWHGTELKLGGNVALGVGFKGSVDIKVDPSRIVSDVVNAPEAAYHEASELLSHVPRPSWPF